MDRVEDRRVTTAINGWFLIVAATAALWVGVSGYDANRLEAIPQNDGSYVLGCRAGEIVFTPGITRHGHVGESLAWPVCQEMWRHRQDLAARPHWFALTTGAGVAMVAWSNWRRGRIHLARVVHLAA